MNESTVNFVPRDSSLTCHSPKGRKLHKSRGASLLAASSDQTPHDRPAAHRKDKSNDRSKKPRRPGANKVREAIDGLRHWLGFQAAILAAHDSALKGGKRAIRSEDLPESFRTEFKPEFDTPNQLEGDVGMRLDLLIEAIRGHSRGGGPAHVFTDTRDGMRWVLLPPGTNFDGPGHLEPDRGMLPDCVPLNCGPIVAFRAGREIVIPSSWVSIEPTESLWAIAEDGGMALKG